MFCDFISLCCLVHLSGRVVLILLDYVNHVPLCSHLRCILEKQKEWAEICTILNNPRSLKHLCRLEIRKYMTVKRLRNIIIMDSFPPPIRNYLLYK